MAPEVEHTCTTTKVILSDHGGGFEAPTHPAFSPVVTTLRETTIGGFGRGVASCVGNGAREDRSELTECEW